MLPGGRRLFANVVCASPAYFERAGRPRTPEDLKAHNCVQFRLSGHAQEWTFTREGQAVRVEIGGRYNVTSSLPLRDALLAGFGLSLIPRLYVESELAEGRLATALGDWAPDGISIYAVYPSRLHVLPKVRAFVDFLAEELGDTI